MTDERVHRAVRAAGIEELDERGLMPLAMARAVVRGNPAFVKGEYDGGVTVADVIWAALLSLEDAGEFCEVATKLAWEFHPRGMQNVDLFARYGNGIVPWLATRVHDGVLVNSPWCIVPCLLACDSQEAFDLVWRVREVRAMGNVALAAQWLDRHPEMGMRCLFAREATDPRAGAQLSAMRARGGAPEVPGPPTEAGVLAHLDACALGLVAPELELWPSKTGARSQYCHGLRLIAAREGDGWGIAIERLEGDRPSFVHPPRVAVYAFGNRVSGRYRGVALGERSVDTAGAPPGPEAFAGWIQARADLAWGASESALSMLGLSAGHIVLTLPAFAHVEPGELPSASETYIAVARALVADHA